MNICFFASAGSEHIIKWSNYFVSQGHNVSVVSFDKNEIPGVSVYYIDCGVNKESSDLKKLKYLFQSREAKKTIAKIAPDIISVHYATSYGAVAALAGLKNYVLSVWGADIYDFPQKSIFHKALLKFSLYKAPFLFSTSRAMADEAGKYTNKHIYITPFGVDTDLFSPQKRDRDDNDFRVGTIKALSYKYGIDYLIRAVAIIKKEHPEIPVKLRIAGRGAQEESFKQLATSLGIGDCVTWLGYISQESAAKEWANFDLSVVYSTLDSESFGVSAVEAQASASPLIIADIPGLMEATQPGRTSIVIPRKQEQALADTIVELYNDHEKRKILGENGRQFVLEKYEYHKCFSNIERLLNDISQRCKE